MTGRVIEQRLETHARKFMRTIITTIALAVFGTWSLAAMAQTGAATGGGNAAAATANGTGTTAPNGAVVNPNQLNGTASNPNPSNTVGSAAAPPNPAGAVTGRGLARPNASGQMSTVPGTGITSGAGGRAGFPGTGPMGQNQSTLPGASMARPNGVGLNPSTPSSNVNNLNGPPGTAGTSAAGTVGVGTAIGSANARMNPNPAGDVSIIEGGRGGFSNGNVGGSTGVNGNVGANGNPTAGIGSANGVITGSLNAPNASNGNIAGTSGTGNGNVAPGGSPNAGLGSVNGQITGQVNPNAARAAQLNSVNANNWRMVNQNGQWWYWTPGNYWMYYSGNAWSRYVPPSAPPLIETPLNGMPR
jgi:hypothetical protein